MAQRQEPGLHSPTVLGVLHAAQDMVRQGTFPTHDRLCSACRGVNEDVVRGAIHTLMNANRFPKPVELIDDEPCEDTAAGTFLGKNRTMTARTINLAIMRIIEGEHVYESLSVLTGLSMDGLKCRAHDARGYPDRETCSNHLDGFERGYLTRSIERHVEMAGDPSVQEFAFKSIAPQRAHPDKRGMVRDHARDRVLKSRFG